MKKSFIYSALVAAFGLMAMTSPVQANWFSDRESNFEPYLESGQHAQNAQYRKETWKVEDWAPTLEAGRTQMDQLFKATVFVDYLKSSSIWHDRSTLIVGPAFYHLSRFDQTRVVTLFDHLYQTTNEPTGTLYLEDQYTGKVIGVYTRWGLQLQ